jgi:hypothetical protein
MLSFNTRKGKELKVPYHASVTATRDGNLPCVTATCYTWRQFASYYNVTYSSYTRSTLKREISIIKNLYTHFSLPYSLTLPYTFRLVLLLVVRSTHSTAFNLIRFILISRLRANNSLLLVIVSIGLLSLLIYLTLAISCLLYNWRRHIILIISLFSYIVPSLIRYL